MKIEIHRGTDQIGGCITEFEHEGWHLFIDYGEQLPGSPKPMPLEIEGLTKGDLTRSALLITHYHSDHIGGIKELPSSFVSRCRGGGSRWSASPRWKPRRLWRRACASTRPNSPPRSAVAASPNPRIRWLTASLAPTAGSTCSALLTRRSR